MSNNKPYLFKILIHFYDYLKKKKLQLNEWTLLCQIFFLLFNKGNPGDKCCKNLPLPQRHTPDLSAHTTKINKADYS